MGYEKLLDLMRLTEKYDLLPDPRLQRFLYVYACTGEPDIGELTEQYIMRRILDRTFSRYQH